MPLVPRVVNPNNFVDIELIRIIRNAGRTTLSHDTQEITVEQQKQYWISNKDNIKAWLYDCPEDDEVAVAVGSLQRRNGKLWAFVAVDTYWQGRGYSKEIMQHLLDMAAPEDVWGMNSMLNPPATYLCVDVGIWRMVSRNHEIITVVYKREDNEISSNSSEA